MTEQELKKLKEGALSVDDILKQKMSEEADYSKVLNVFVKQQKVISDEESRNFNEKMQEKRYELEKDKVYSSQNLEEKRFNKENEIKEKEISLNEEKNKALIDIEKLKFDLELKKFELESKNNENNVKNAFEERKFRYISLGITTFASLAGIIIPLIVYKKLAYANLKLIYRDEGRPTQDFKDSVRLVKQLTK